MKRMPRLWGNGNSTNWPGKQYAKTWNVKTSLLSDSAILPLGIYAKEMTRKACKDTRMLAGTVRLKNRKQPTCVLGGLVTKSTAKKGCLGHGGVITSAITQQEQMLSNSVSKCKQKWIWKSTLSRVHTWRDHRTALWSSVCTRTRMRKKVALQVTVIFYVVLVIIFL